MRICIYNSFTISRFGSCKTAGIATAVKKRKDANKLLEKTKRHKKAKEAKSGKGLFFETASHGKRFTFETLQEITFLYESLGHYDPSNHGIFNH